MRMLTLYDRVCPNNCIKHLTAFFMRAHYTYTGRQ